MAKFENLRKALTGPLNGLLTGIDIVYPNQSHEPQVGQAFIQVFVLPNQPQVATLGVTGRDVHTGVLQLSLYFPKSQTDFPLLRTADEIEAAYQAYARGQYLTSDGVSARVTSIGIGPTTTSDAWFFAPVNINYESHIQGVN